jgi:hypothetical protein
MKDAWWTWLGSGVALGWSDMFDPFHNAKKTGEYYSVKGDGPGGRSPAGSAMPGSSASQRR